MSGNSNDSTEPGDALQTELVRRVMSLEGREETLRLSNAKLETTIDALAECTDVSRANIRAIAEELARKSATDTIAECPPSSSGSTTRSPLRYVALAAAVLLVTVIFLATRSTTPALTSTVSLVPATPDGAHNEAVTRHFKLQAKLAGAMADISHIRMMVAMEYQDGGVFPESVEQLGLDPSTLSSRHVKAVALEPGGTVVGFLPDQFGEDKWFRFTPGWVMGGMQIEWSCEANLSADLLSHSPCKSV